MIRLKEYVLSDPGKLCADESFDDIKDKEECIKAYNVVKEVYFEVKKDKISYSATWPQRPKGCFLHLENGAVHWNPHSSGNRNFDDRQICKNGKYV